MADRLEGANQLNEILFQSPIDSFPHRDNYSKITALVASHALSIEALENGGSPPASSSAEVIAARDDQVDLQTAMRKGDEIIGDGIFKNVVNEFLIKETTGVPDDKVDVDTGEAIINGIKVLTGSVQVVDPANFSAASLERVDVIHVDSSGTVGVVTGSEVALGSGLAEAEQVPDNTVILGELFLRSGAGNLSPFPPEDIEDDDDLSNSFIMVNRQRFFVQRDRTDAHRQFGNWLRNGAFLSIDANGVLDQWTITNGTLVQDATEFKFGDFSGKFTGDNTLGGSFIEIPLPSPESLRGRFVTVSAYMKLDSGTIAKTGRITVVQTGDTPESDFSETIQLNAEKFSRVHVVGFIDNSVTAVSVRLELDTTDPSTVAGFLDGVQFSIGKILTEFEYPERIRLSDVGILDFPGGRVLTDTQFEANLAWQFPPPMDIFTNISVWSVP